jgi:hypothetical protein
MHQRTATAVRPFALRGTTKSNASVKRNPVKYPEELEAVRLAMVMRMQHGAVSALLQMYEALREEWNREPTEQEVERALDIFQSVSYVIFLLISIWIGS